MDQMQDNEIFGRVQEGFFLALAVLITGSLPALGCEQAPAATEVHRDAEDVADSSTPADGSGTDAASAEVAGDVADAGADQDQVDAKADLTGGIDCVDGIPKKGCPCNNQQDWCCVSYAQGLSCEKSNPTEPPKWTIAWDCCIESHPDCGEPKGAGQSRYCNVK